MEHFVQFAVNIDDEFIKRKVESNAYDEILERIYEKLKPSIENVLKPYHRDTGFNKALEMATLKVIEDHKDEIIERVATKVSNRIKKEMEKDVDK